MTEEKCQFKFKSKAELDALRKKSFGERFKIMQERARKRTVCKIK